MNVRSGVLSAQVLSLLLMVLLAPAMSSGYQSSSLHPARNDLSKQRVKTGETVFTVVNLKHLRVGEANRIATNLAGNKIRITEDIPSNSLIVAYQSQDREVFQSLVRLLSEVDGNYEKRDGAKTVRSYALKGLPSQFVLNFVSMSFTNSDVRAQSYPKEDSLIVMASKKDHDKLSDFLALLRKDGMFDGGKEKHIDLCLVTTMVIDGEQTMEKPGKNHTQPNDRLKSVIDRTVERGLVNMKTPIVVSQTVNRISVDANKRGIPFSNLSSSLRTSNNSFQFRVSGNVGESTSEVVALDLDIQITNENKTGTLKSNISSHVRTRMGKPIMLGLSKINGIDTLVSIEVFAEK